MYIHMQKKVPSRELGKLKWTCCTKHDAVRMTTVTNLHVPINV